MRISVCLMVKNAHRGFLGRIPNLVQARKSQQEPFTGGDRTLLEENKATGRARAFLHFDSRHPVHVIKGKPS